MLYEVITLCGVYILFNTSIFNARLLPFSVLILAALVITSYSIHYTKLYDR